MFSKCRVYEEVSRAGRYEMRVGGGRIGFRVLGVYRGGFFFFLVSRGV